VGEQYRSFFSSLWSFLHSTVTSSLLGPNILLRPRHRWKENIKMAFKRNTPERFGIWLILARYRNQWRTVTRFWNCMRREMRVMSWLRKESTP
jgi:hypothetical protein